jgi:hypothetical protein
MSKYYGFIERLDLIDIASREGRTLRLAVILRPPPALGDIASGARAG